MQKDMFKKIKLFIVLVIICFFIWFLVIFPLISFHSNEKKLKEAAIKYFDLYSDQLPIGERVKTLSLSTLYRKSFIKSDLKTPYTGNNCSVENSWVKVKKVNNDYKYYVFLDCGLMKSSVDHAGPVLKLNGESTMTIGIGEKYDEPGVYSVVDNADGRIDTNKVNIRGKVDTSKIGTYELTYSISDSLSNKTTVTRSVRVVKEFGKVVKNMLGSSKNFVGTPDNNYVLFSNILFRIYGLDDKGNVILVSDKNIAYVNHSKLSDWSDYFYEMLNESSKKMLVKSKFCNMKVDKKNLDTTQCNSYTNERYVYVPSIVEVNKNLDYENSGFMRNVPITWLANTASSSKGYITAGNFMGDESKYTYIAENSNFNYGVRPMLIVKGSSLITSGSGLSYDPYVFGDKTKAKGGDLLSTRFTGEYFEYDGMIWRIIETEGGLTKAITTKTLGEYDDAFVFPALSNSYIYDPTVKNDYAYKINNNVSEYLNTSIFAKHYFNVPIYKSKVIFNEEVKVKRYSMKIFAPNMYEIFAAPEDESHSFWVVNSSQEKNVLSAISDIGVPYNSKPPVGVSFGVRVVGYVKSDVVITTGNGTYMSPYKIK